jgi:hypothetical protein
MELFLFQKWTINHSQISCHLGLVILVKNIEIKDIKSSLNFVLFTIFQIILIFS